MMLFEVVVDAPIFQWLLLVYLYYFLWQIAVVFFGYLSAICLAIELRWIIVNVPYMNNDGGIIRFSITCGL